MSGSHVLVKFVTLRTQKLLFRETTTEFCMSENRVEKDSSRRGNKVPACEEGPKPDQRRGVGEKGQCQVQGGVTETVEKNPQVPVS